MLFGQLFTQAVMQCISIYFHHSRLIISVKHGARLLLPDSVLNTFLLVSFILPGQLLISTLAAYAFVRFKFTGANVAFALVLVQLMITPEILIVQNYVTLSKLGLVDTISGMGLPYIASAFCIFLLRQAFKSIPKELEDAAELEGCGTMSYTLEGLCSSCYPNIYCILFSFCKSSLE